METMEEKILAALQKSGPMTSHELCAALEMEWTEFSIPLLNMLRTMFNPEGPVINTRTPRGQVYHLPEKVVQ